MKVFTAILIGGVVFASPSIAQFGIDTALESIPSAGESEVSKEPDQSTGETANDSQSEQGRTSVDLVSPFCYFTFFSNGNDNLTFSDTSGDPCFDTGKGMDKFSVKSSDFAEGMFVYSDEGQSQFRLSNGPNFFFDSSGTSAEVRTGYSDDILRFGLPYSKGEVSGVLSETLIFPGGGNDLVVIGVGASGDAVYKREVLNAFIYPEGDSLEIDAGCGRNFDDNAVDFIVENSRETTQLNVQVSGCGVALRNHSSPTVLTQTGGRTILALRPSSPGSNVDFKGDVSMGSGLSAVSVEPGTNTNLKWQGFGNASLQIETSLPSSMGIFDVTSDGFAQAGLIVDSGKPHVSLTSSTTAELTLSGDNVAGSVIEISAPDIRLEWMMSSLTPPSITLKPSFSLPVLEKEKSDIESEGSVSNVSEEEEIIIQPVDTAPSDKDVAVVENKEESKEENKDVKEEVSEESVENDNIRDALGRTPAGMMSLNEGRPVNDISNGFNDVAPTIVTQEFESGPVLMTLRPEEGICASINVIYPNSSESLSCSQGGRVNEKTILALEFVSLSGVIVKWDISNLNVFEMTVDPR